MFHHKQYFFSAQCIWWISALVGLQPVLVYYLENQWFPSEVTTASLRSQGYQLQEVSTTPRDIRRESNSPKGDTFIDNPVPPHTETNWSYIADPVPGIRNERVNLLLKSKKVLQKEQARFLTREEEVSQTK